MKLKISKKYLLQVFKQIILQQQQAPKGTNIKKVLKTRKQAGKQGASWTQLHNRINNKGQNSDWSSKHRGNNISAINRAAGRNNGNLQQGDPEQSAYKNAPLIKKNQQGQYIITQQGNAKLRQLQHKLQKDNIKNQIIKIKKSQLIESIRKIIKDLK